MFESRRSLEPLSLEPLSMEPLSMETLQWTPPLRPPLASEEHAAWRRLIRQRCGLDFGSSRTSYLSRCLWERTRAVDACSYHEYYTRMSDRNAVEWDALVELLVNGESSFFRHQPSYEGLRQLLPELLRRKAAQRDFGLRLWSAGCSHGQEPYSMAICALEAIAGQGPAWQTLVVGSDLSRRALAAAGLGRYRSSALARVPELVRRRYFRPVGGPEGRHGGEVIYEVRGPLRTAIRFHHWNLVEPEGWQVGRQDVIFCQNLLIYLHHDDRLEAMERLYCRLRPGGYLFLAPGEVVGWRRAGVRTRRIEDCLVYQREP